VVTAQHPAGPWSDPVWLEGMGGIDPSLFVDSDGRAYFVNNDEPPGEAAYDGHRALWVQEFDLASLRLIGPRRMIVNGGADFSQQPIWIEGPHFFRRDGQLYLIAAEGGTAEGHSQVVFKADSVFGPLEPYAGNPILTQRHLDPAREAPVTSVGHADFVQDAEGEWWSVFLGTRPYAGDFYNTGRETFLLPVRWEGGWPLITRGDERVPYQVERPALPPAAAPAIPTSGNFRLRDEFSGERIAPYWLQLRTPGGRPWVDTRTEAGTLLLTPRAERLDGVGNPSFLARRQQHAHASASTRMRYHPRLPGERAGMAAFQNGAYYYFLGVERRSDGPLQLVVTRRAGDPERTLRRLDLDAPAAAPLDLRLRIRASAGVYDFDYALGEGPWQAALEGADGRLLSTRTAGGFVGTVFGLYAERPAAGEGEMPGAAAP
jgi:xylan 1,4-beta-xylosidase